MWTLEINHPAARGTYEGLPDPIFEIRLSKMLFFLVPKDSITKSVWLGTTAFNRIIDNPGPIHYFFLENLRS